MKAIPARFAGRCCATGTEYQAGALIVKTRDGWELVTVNGGAVVIEIPERLDETPAATAPRPGPCDVHTRRYRTAPDPTITAGIIQAVAAILSGFWHR